MKRSRRALVFYVLSLLFLTFIYVLDTWLRIKGDHLSSFIFYSLIAVISLFFSYFMFSKQKMYVDQVLLYLIGVWGAYILTFNITKWLPIHYVRKKYGMDIAFAMFQQKPVIGFIILSASYLLLFALQIFFSRNR